MGKSIPFEVFSRPLWDWGVEIVQQTYLAEQMTWDAERISKFNGQEWVRVIHEPWTAQHFWDAQASLFLL
jgi:hypothetical protein